MISIKLPENKRSKLAIKNIFYSLIIKGGSIFITFILVSITLGYLDAYEYGIWLTLNSILSWVYLFDIGLGNGLKNKLTEALAVKDFQMAKTYIATTFFLMTCLGAAMYFIFFIIQLFLDWHSILNVSPDVVTNLNTIMVVVFALVTANFVLRTIGIIHISNQYQAINDFFSLCANVIILVLIYTLTKTTHGSLQLVAYIFTGIPVLFFILVIPITFRYYPHLRPSFKDINLAYGKSLMSLGLKFFFIQIAFVVTFMTSNIIISKIFGPEEVTPYNLAFKMFSVVTIGFNIILAPFWSAITDAVTRNEMLWVMNVRNKLIKFWILTSVGTIFLIILSPWIYRVWIGNDVEIPFSLSLLSGIYVIIYSLANIFNYIINGFGKLHLQLIFSMIQAIIYIPLAIICCHIFGVKGILIALCLIVAISFLWSPLQTHKLIHHKASGIWNK